MRAMIWLAVAVAGAGLVTACKDSQKPNENLAPNANFTFGCPALQCDFHDASTDDGTIASWNWSFGAEGSSERNPIYNYPSGGDYQVSLTVTDDEGVSSSISKTVDPKAPAVAKLSCVDASAPGGFVSCKLTLTEAAGYKVVLESTSCEARGNLFRVTEPVVDTLTSDGCYEQPGQEILRGGPYPAGTQIGAEVIAPILQNAPRLKVSGQYPKWTLEFEDGVDQDFNDLVMTLTALPAN
jgi:PKD domain-containing protein